MNNRPITRSAVIHLDAAPGTVLPLFTPRGEYHWAPGWDPEFIYPASGEAGTNTVFATRHTGQSGAQEKTIWLTIVYDTEHHHVEYVNFTPASHLSRIAIHCQLLGEDRTQATVSYTLIATEPQGQAELDRFSAERFASHMQFWQQSINQYLETGESKLTNAGR